MSSDKRSTRSISAPAAQSPVKLLNLKLKYFQVWKVMGKGLYREKPLENSWKCDVVILPCRAWLIADLSDESHNSRWWINSFTVITFSEYTVIVKSVATSNFCVITYFLQRCTCNSLDNALLESRKTLEFDGLLAILSPGKQDWNCLTMNPVFSITPCSVSFPPQKSYPQF